MSKGIYRKLKENRGTVTIKVEEVLQPIFVKGLLSKREMQIVFAVIADSWRWGNGQYTQRHITAASLHRLTGISKGNASRISRDLVRRNVINVDEQGRASFNEHSETWGVPKSGTIATTRGSQIGNPPFPNREPKVPISGTQTPLNPKTGTAIHNPKNNIKSNIKNKESGAQEKRAPAHPRFQEFVDWWHTTYETKYGVRYVWDTKDGANLRRLLARLDFDELKARCEYALEHAGKPGRLEWFKPPFTFSQFGQSRVINCCLELNTNGGYVTADQLLTREESHERTTSRN